MQLWLYIIRLHIISLILLEFLVINHTYNNGLPNVTVGSYHSKTFTPCVCFRVDHALDIFSASTMTEELAK